MSLDVRTRLAKDVRLVSPDEALDAVLPQGDVVPVDPAARAERAGLSDVQSRIEAADNQASPRRYRAGRGR